MKPIFRVLAVAFFGLLLSGVPVRAQGGVSADTAAEIHKQMTELKKQVEASNAFVAARETELVELEKVAQAAPEDVEKLIADLEALTDRFKAGSTTATTIQRAMEEIKVQIDRYREGSDAQKQAAELMRVALGNFEKSDAERDVLVGQALATIRKLRAQKDDLIAFQIAGAYAQMATVYGDMIGSFRQTLNQAGSVVSSIEAATPVPVQ